MKAPLTLPGKAADAIFEGNLLHEADAELDAAWEARSSRKVGFGSQVTLEVSGRLRDKLLGYLTTLAELERQIADGAGDGADLSLARAIEALVKREAELAECVYCGDPTGTKYDEHDTCREQSIEADANETKGAP